MKLYQTGLLNKNIKNEGKDSAVVPMVHHSDAIRIALIHKYGGWYSDLDMVFLKPINHLRNVLGSDSFQIHESKRNPDFLGTKVSNAIFQFDTQQHPFLQKCLDKFAQVFDGTWGSGGPTLFQLVLNQMCGSPGAATWLSKKTYNPENCQGISVVPPRQFYPAPWLSASSTLSSPKPKEEWDDLFQDSHTVHFYASSNPGHRVNKPRFYGNSFPAYVYLAPKHCPLAFDAQRMF